jgi:capsular polysaccharide biosynthesis protein
LIETLPKLLFLDAILPGAIPVLVSERIPKSALESLRLLSSRRIFQVSTEELTSVDQLFVCSPVIYHPDPVELHLSPTTRTINMDALGSLRSRVLNEVAQSPERSKQGRLVFVSRNSGSRSLINALRVEKMLRKEGFDVIDPSQMSFLSQVRAFQAADKIVLAGGASMANLIFCSEGTKIVLLRSRFTRGYKMPEILASLSSSLVVSISGLPVGTLFRNSYLEKIHSHYMVPIHRLKKSISKMS